VRSALEDAAELGFERVQLTGGDPLVSDLCVPAAQYAAELGLGNVEVYTNGLALLGRVYEQLAKLETRFAFSFYSHDAATHDAITRTPGSQRRTLAVIKRAVEDGLRVRVSVIVMDSNRDHLEPTLQLLRDVGLPDHALGVDVQRSVGRGLMTIRPKDGLKGAWLSHQDSTVAGSSERESGTPEVPRTLGGHRETGDQGRSGRAAVAYDGTVFPCIFSRAFPLGRLPEQRLKEVLADETPLEVSSENLASEYSRRQEQLACWDCRMRATVLGMQRSMGAET
jgi:MoaA/NifB/PqqE/SkfB family radical SAM enzyme